MFDYETLRVIWWLTLGTLLIGFAVMDGMDLGVGVVFRFIGRTDQERRVLLASVEPVWDGYRNKIADTRRRNTWDWAVFFGCTIPALLCGIAIGNMFLGLPFHFDELRRPVYTGELMELLHPYALLTGFVSVSMLVMHGCAYAALKAGEPLSGRALALGRTAAGAFIFAFLISGVWVSVAMSGYRLDATVSGPTLNHVYVTQKGWLENYRVHASLWIAPGSALLLAFLTRILLGVEQARAAFVTSSLTLAATIVTAGFALFPFLMPSSEAHDDSLTVWNASSSARALGILLLMAAIFLPRVSRWCYSRGVQDCSA